MANKTKRKFVVRLIKRNKKTMKGGVACQSAALFKYKNNSCYLDTILIGWLHFADADLRAALVDRHEAGLEKRKKYLIQMLIEIYDSLKLYGPGPAKDVKEITALREEFRNTLQQCEDFTDLMPESDLKRTQAADEIYTKLIDYIGIKNIKIKNEYRGFRGYTEEEKNILMQQNPGRNRNQIDTFNPDVPEPSPRESDIGEINIIILKPAEGSLIPQTLVSTPLDSRRNNRGNDYYMVEPKIAGTLYGILPISIERRIFDSNNNTLRNHTEIILESHIELDDGLYALVSVICFVSDPDHYVAYYKCNEGDNWIYYDDLGINLDKMVGGTGCEEDIRGIFTKWLEEYSGLVSEKIEKFDNELSTIINDSEGIITDSLTTELLEQIITQVCKKNEKNIKKIVEQWWITTQEMIVKSQWNNIKETAYYKDLKPAKVRGRSPEQQEIFDIFKEFEKSRKSSIHELIDLINPKKAKTTRVARVATDKPLYMDMGHIENWQDVPMPGYKEDSPRQAATLLFYKKIDG